MHCYGEEPQVEFEVIHCPHCRDTGHVCEHHPDKPWEGMVSVQAGACPCGGAGMPCPACCSPVPQDGSYSITAAFTPDWMRC